MPFKNIPWTGIVLTSVGVSVGGYIVYRLYNSYQYDACTLPVQVCNNLADWMANESKFVEILANANVIGLDCEWVTVDGHRNAVALLQLATADGFCVLIRLCNIPPWLMPSGLIGLLSDNKVMKVGVGIMDDAKKLLIDYGLTVHGCLDLRQLVQHREEFKNKGMSLQTMAECLLDAKLKKTKSLSCSDWEALQLSPKQVAYAAEDALAAAQIFEKLKLEHGVFTLNDIKLFSDSFLDVPYTFNHQSKNSQDISKSQLRPKKEIKSKKILTRKHPMYENCHLQAPDGEPLCSCDRKKADWYLERGRGEVVKENPFTVRLNFEPSGRPILDNQYYVQEKQNYCVVCGETKFFFRKAIVPTEYRRYFPDLMKRNLSHDVLLLCVSCHRRSNLLDQKLRQELARECNAPVEANTKIFSNQQLAMVKSAAKALLKSNARIPQDRLDELNEIVHKHFQTNEVTKKQLEEASKFQVRTINNEYVPHGLQVYRHMCQNGGLIQLELRWREHFLKTMKPKFMPTMWSVNHNHERLALQVTKNEVNFDIKILGLSAELLERVKEM